MRVDSAWWGPINMHVRDMQHFLEDWFAIALQGHDKKLQEGWGELETGIPRAYRSSHFCEAKRNVKIVSSCLRLSVQNQSPSIQGIFDVHNQTAKKNQDYESWVPSRTLSGHRCLCDHTVMCDWVLPLVLASLQKKYDNVTCAYIMAARSSILFTDQVWSQHFICTVIKGLDLQCTGTSFSYAL